MAGGVNAIIGADLKTVGFAIDNNGAFVGRFVDEIPPHAWRDALKAEWDAGDGAVWRAIQRLEEAGHAFAGIFNPPVYLDPNDGALLCSPVSVD